MVWQGQEGTSSRRRANRALGPGQHHRGIPTVIVDHSALFRAGLTHMLSGTRFRVVEDRARLQDIPKSIFNHHVSLVLVGLNYAGPAVLSELSLLKAEHEDLRIVIFSDRFDLKELLTTIAFGADCYLLKHDVSPQALLQSLELVLLGETVISSGFTELIRSQLRPSPEALSSRDFSQARMEYPRPLFAGEEPPTVDTVVRLSNREQLILRHLTRGASNKQIARELNVSEATVKTHVKTLHHKIGVRNRTQAAMWAMDHLVPSHLERGKSSEGSRDLSMFLARLGLDPAEEPAATPQARPTAHAIVGSPPLAAGQRQRI